MKSSCRWLSRFALLMGIGVAQLVACSSDSRNSHSENEARGSLQLPLQATAASGNVYRLRSAFFQITNIHDGSTVAFLSSEDDPGKAVLSAVLDTGDYTVTLQPGWFMERLGGSDPGNTGGAAGKGGSGPVAGTGGAAGKGGSGPVAGTGGFGAVGNFGSGGGFGEAGSSVVDPPVKVVPTPIPFPDEIGGFAGVGGDTGVGATDTGGLSNFGGKVGAGGRGPAGGSAAGGRFGGTGGVFATGGVFSTGGVFATGGSGGQAVIVDAQLTNDAVQPFSVLSRADSFVTFTFQIGGEVISFNQGRVNIGIQVNEAEPQCQTPSDVTRPQRVLLETEVSAVSVVSLREVFDALAKNGGFTGDGEALFNQIYDSYASKDRAQIPDAVHCGDEMTGSVPTLNGFPLRCDRIEANHVGSIDSFRTTAIVNRPDFIPANGAHCGQQRMVFASGAISRAFMIVEAQIPNPHPELGAKGCLPLAEFWFDQNQIDDPAQRGLRLKQAFLQGDPKLAEQGFGAFYTATNLTVGSGQIRTNQFDDAPWTLREFKLALDGTSLKAIPFPTAEAPNGALWDENSGLPQGAACRDNFLTAMKGVLSSDMSQMAFIVDQPCKDAESQNDFSQDYDSRLSPGFRQTLAAQLVGTGLTPQDIANRARFSGSCIGCHNESSGANLGGGVTAPFSSDFVHVSEFITTCGSQNPGGSCFETSSAVKDVFLPGRLNTLAGLLGVPIVTDPCSNGNGGAGGGSSGGPVIIAPPPKEPPPRVVIELPQASEPVADLVEEDAKIREQNGSLTISGRSAQATH